MSEEKKTIEESLTEIDEIIKKLEDQSTSLEESFRVYEAGMKLVKEVNDRIDEVEQKITVLNAEGGEDDEELG